jgi:hypothetical protein
MDSGFSELFRQLPPGIPITFCVSAVLLVVVIGYSIRSRGQRAKAALAAAGPANPSAPGLDLMTADLPDLDSLSSTNASLARASGGLNHITLASGEMVDAVEVFTVLRDVGEGGLIIRIGDRAYRNPPTSADAEFKRRLQTALRDLNTAPTVVPSAPAAASADPNARFQPPPPPPAPAPEPVIDDALPDPNMDDIDMPSEADLAAAPLPPLKPRPSVSMTDEVPRVANAGVLPGDLPKFKMPDTPVKPKRGQKPVKEPIPEINIAASIEAFLQHKLALTPEYISRSIHVRSASHGGVDIEVDGIFYDSVSEVADPAVRQYLADTIQEWQARQ